MIPDFSRALLTPPLKGVPSWGKKALLPQRSGSSQTEPCGVLSAGRHQTTACSRGGKLHCECLQPAGCIQPMAALLPCEMVILRVKDIPVLISQMTVVLRTINPIYWIYPGHQFVNDRLQKSFDSKKYQALGVENCSKFRLKVTSSFQGSHRRPPPLTYTGRDYGASKRHCHRSWNL